MNLTPSIVPTQSVPILWRNLQSVLDAGQDSIFGIDTNFNLQLFNQAYVEFYQDFSDEYLKVGIPVADLFTDYPQFLDEIIKSFARVFLGDSLFLEEEISYQGKSIQVELRFNPLHNEENIIIGGTCMIKNYNKPLHGEIEIMKQVSSLEESKRFNRTLLNYINESTFALVNAEKVLSITDQKYRSIYEFSPSGIVLFDRENKIIEANPALLRILKYSAKEFIEIPLTDHVLVTKTDLVLINKLFDGEIESYETEKKFFRSDGKVVWGLVNVSILYNNEEEKLYAIASIQDITSRMELDSALKQKNKELEKTNSYLDNFVYAVAHDLRSPIANLKQISELIQMLNKGNDPIYDKLKTSVDRLDCTASGLIEIIDSQKVEGNQTRAVLFTKKVAQIQEDLDSHILDLGAQFQYDFEVGKLTYIEPYLESILRNLIQNALKYSHPKRRPEIKISTYRQAGFVVLSVQDNGIGIDLKKAGNRLFRPFKRFTDMASGHGIGLHLIKSMVEKNDGKIEVISKLDKGSTFNIYLKPYEFFNI